jgi:tRNA dimethylallyltransferase
MVDDIPRLIIISGPTGSGKSGLAVELAAILGGEIISADSMQVYRGMDIGTAKLPLSERKGIPHHLIDILNPDQEFNAALFLVHAVPIIKRLHAKHIPIIVVGGTNLYVRALLGGLFHCPPSNGELRRNLWEECERKGPSFLYERLSRLDRGAAERIHSSDRVRIIRALEVINLTGYQFSELIGDHHFSDKRFASLNLCLHIDRQILYHRINRRTISMMEAGFINEVEVLLQMGYNSKYKAMQAIGYRHIVAYLQHGWSFDETISLIQRDTRRYAKRQLTWLRGEPDIMWVNPDDKAEILNKVKAFIASQH